MLAAREKVCGEQKKRDAMNKRLCAVCRALLPLLLLLTLLVLTLASCTEAGSEDVYSKEILQENVTRGASSKADSVWECFDEWDFPRFSKSKLSSIESSFRKHFYRELDPPATLATKAAEIFLDKYYDGCATAGIDEVTDALARSYVEALGDDFSYYRTKEEYLSYSTGLSGSFVGIGITARQLEGSERILVASVIEGGGAAEAGVAEGDIIISVDGKSADEIGYQAAINAIGGESGTSVTLGILREGDVLDITVLRRKIDERTVSYKLTDGIGYIKITGFKSNTDEQFKEAVDYMERGGAVGVIYDLRSNGGGYLSTVENMLDYIAPKGVKLVSFSNDYDDDYVAKDKHTFLIPTVVLCNRGTASAAELFTAAVRDLSDMGYMRAITVGEKTFGKGVMQNTYRLTDGSAITMTVAFYNPPSGKNYNGVGISPNIAVERESVSNDTQLERAYEEIRKIII